MLKNDCPRWMAPVTLIAGFIGLIIALFGEFGAGLEFKGGAIVFMPLALIITLLALVFCVISAIVALRKAMTMLEAIIRAVCVIAAPGLMALLALIAGKTPDSGIKTVSLVYTLLFLVGLTVFWWFHTFPILDYVAEIMVAVMICTNYKMVDSMGVGALWLHRIVCLLALVAMVWGACRLIGDGEPIMGLVGLVAPLVAGIIWMVFEGSNRAASYVWMLIPIAAALLGTFIVCGFVYDFIHEFFGGGSSSRSGGDASSSHTSPIGGSSSGEGKTPDPHGKEVRRYVLTSDFKNSDSAWDVRLNINGTTIYVKGTYRVEKERYQAASGAYTSDFLATYARRIVESSLAEYYARYDGPGFSLSYDLGYKLI